MGHYQNLYLKTDVLLIADFFENFKKRSVENYGLDQLKKLLIHSEGYEEWYLLCF